MSAVFNILSSKIIPSQAPQINKQRKKVIKGGEDAAADILSLKKNAKIIIVNRKTDVVKKTLKSFKDLFEMAIIKNKNSKTKT